MKTRFNCGFSRKRTPRSQRADLKNAGELILGVLRMAAQDDGEMRSAMKLPQQARSQAPAECGKLGNEEQIGGFTLLEMIITLAIFVLLAAAVFGMLTGIIESTGTLQDNQNRTDQISALNAYLKKKLEGMPVASSLVSYQRGDGEGLVQNGIVYGTANYASVIDAKVQANGYYTLRLATFSTSGASGEPQDARTALVQDASSDDPSVVWTPLVKDIKTLDWKFLDFNQTQWVDLWTSSTKPNLVEFSMQPAGDLQLTTMDFWLPKIDTINLNATAQPSQPSQPKSP